MANEIMGVQGRLGVKEEVTEGTAVTVDSLLELTSGDLALAETELHAQGLSGSRSQWAARTRANLRRASGSLSLEPNAAEWALLLPWILGADASGTTYALAESLQAFTATIKRDNGTDGKVATYNGCKVARAVISSEQGSAVKLQLDVEARDEAIGNAGTFPSLTLNVATGPFLHTDSVGAITVGGTAFPCRRVSITIDNALDTERFVNSLTRTGIQPKDRIITVELGGPYGGKEALYPTAANLAAGVAVVITYTNTIHAVSLALSLPKVHFPRKSPPWNGREEFDLVLTGVARASAAVNDELAVTLDSTP